MHGPNSFLLLAGRFIFECASKPFLPTLHMQGVPGPLSPPPGAAV